MKRPKTKYVILILFVLGLLTLVWYLWLNPKKALRLAIPDINELSFINAKIVSDTAYIDVIGVLENKAPYKISIDSLTYSLKLANVTLISERQKIGIQQFPGSKDTVVLTFRVPISKTRTLIQKLQNKDSTNLKANFDITYSTIFGRTTIPFPKEIKIKVPNPPEIKLLKVKAGDLNLKQKNIDLDIVVSIKNNSEKIELRLNNLVYDATIGNNIKGKGKYNKLIVIKPSSTITTILPINVIVDKPFQVFWKIVANKEIMPYEINMNASLMNDTLQNLPISFNALGEVQLLK